MTRDVNLPTVSIALFTAKKKLCYGAIWRSVCRRLPNFRQLLKWSQKSLAAKTALGVVPLYDCLIWPAIQSSVIRSRYAISKCKVV